jgi:adenine deaminase
MAAMVRQSTGWRDLERQLPALLEQEEPLETRRVLLCTDDRHAVTIVKEGHMEGIVRTAIEHGVPPITAIQMASLNTAEHFGVADDIGSIAPGRSADLFLTDDLRTLAVDVVIAAGEVVAEGGTLSSAWTEPEYPPSARTTVHLPRALQAIDFAPALPGADGAAIVRTIQVHENDVVTEAATAAVEIHDGKAVLPSGDDLGWLAVIERHHGSGRVAHGVVRGFTLTEPCALASTVAHDSHNLIVLGTSFERMAEAANRVAELHGGICLVDADGTRTEVPLPIAGLLSERAAAEVAALEEEMDEAFRRCGCRLSGAVMMLTFLALPVIPALRLTDRGLVDVLEQRVVPLVVDADNP